MPKSNINSADDSGERDGGRERERGMQYMFFLHSPLVQRFCQFPSVSVSFWSVLSRNAWHLQAGATVAAVATRRPKRWAELIALARRSAGTLLVPVSPQNGEVKNDEDRDGGWRMVMTYVEYICS